MIYNITFFKDIISEIDISDSDGEDIDFLIDNDNCILNL